jgi:hypothetical protein
MHASRHFFQIFYGPFRTNLPALREGGSRDGHAASNSRIGSANDLASGAKWLRSGISASVLMALRASLTMRKPQAARASECGDKLCASRFRRPA